MQLVEIRENAVTVELDWSDVRYLAFIIRHAISYDVGSSAHEPTMFVTYADTVEALLLSGGMASWAQTTDEKEYSLERFLEVVPVTPAEHRAEEERRAASRREMERERRPREAPPAA